jgi:flagellar hook-associated protein 3 FlgL
MSMRITFNSQFRDGAAAIATASERLIEAQRQVATGRRLNRVSDDPTATASSVAERNSLSGIEQYTRTADGVASRLTVIDTVLSDIVEMLTKAQSVAMSGRGSTKTTEQRASAAEELRGIRSGLLENFNTSFQGTYVFAGANSTTPPFTVGGGGAVNPYAGSAAELEVEIGDGRVVTMAFDGNTFAQGADAEHLFDAMDDLIAAVTTGDEIGVTTGLNALERAFTRATGAQSRLGNDMNEINSQKLRLQQMKLSTNERLSKLESANMAEAITTMANAEAAYQAALAAVSTATRVSLLDYLK